MPSGLHKGVFLQFPMDNTANNSISDTDKAASANAFRFHVLLWWLIRVSHQAHKQHLTKFTKSYGHTVSYSVFLHGTYKPSEHLQMTLFCATNRKIKVGLGGGHRIYTYIYIYVKRSVLFFPFHLCNTQPAVSLEDHFNHYISFLGPVSTDLPLAGVIMKGKANQMPGFPLLCC